MKKVRYIISLPTPLVGTSEYPSTHLALSNDGETVWVVNNDLEEAIELSDEWGMYTVYFPENIKNELQEKFNNSLVVEKVTI